MAGFDINQLFAQAQALQEKMRKAQEELARQEVVGQSGGGLVSVTADGTGRVTKVQLDPGVVTRDDVGMLEDLVVSAVNQALQKAQQLQQQAAAQAAGPLAGLQDLMPPGMPR